MTSAHRPQYHPAVGSSNPGGYAFIAPRQQVSVHQLASHTVLKKRRIGQGHEQEIPEREELKQQLEEKETKTKEKRMLMNAGVDGIGISQQQQQQQRIEAGEFDDSDEDPPDEDEKDRESDDEESDQDDSDDEQALLMKELARIKQERREEQAKQANPIIGQEPDEFRVKRRWGDDVVFRNQAKNEQQAPKRFINDTTRNDFHKRFMYRYIK